jgi:hypothetical protein
MADSGRRRKTREAACLTTRRKSGRRTAAKDTRPVTLADAKALARAKEPKAARIPRTRPRSRAADSRVAARGADTPTYTSCRPIQLEGCREHAGTPVADELSGLEIGLSAAFRPADLGGGSNVRTLVETAAYEDFTDRGGGMTSWTRLVAATDTLLSEQQKRYRQGS